MITEMTTSSVLPTGGGKIKRPSFKSRGRCWIEHQPNRELQGLPDDPGVGAVHHGRRTGVKVQRGGGGRQPGGLNAGHHEKSEQNASKRVYNQDKGHYSPGKRRRGTGHGREVRVDLAKEALYQPDGRSADQLKPADGRGTSYCHKTADSCRISHCHTTADYRRTTESRRSSDFRGLSYCRKTAVCRGTEEDHRSSNYRGRPYRNTTANCRRRAEHRR
ncbi:unnamed protein product [Macrosiphum euphorbiae]|uniref:Uncharacterized protein n=1 Tax=Macrosiphum euphorbiae TaxID=13131 RepID=A0AAV0VQ26_9HEMI|nr:unnamed protein product [Macrosiphum euphorbiae]